MNPIHRRNASTRDLTLSIALVAVLLATPTVGWQFPYDATRESRLELVASWRDPGGEGADLAIAPSYNGSLLLLVGYGAPGEVRVADLDMATVAVLEPPHPCFVATGATWSMHDRRVAAWGRAPSDDRDVIALYDAPSFERVPDPPWLALVDLVEVHVVCFHADDLIVSVAGRDVNGASRLAFIETEGVAVRTEVEWPGNHTLIGVVDNGRGVVITDSGGTIALITTSAWVVTTRFEGALVGGATAGSVPQDHPWALGDAAGSVVASVNIPSHPQYNYTVGDGPVQGLAWTWGRYLDLVVAVPGPGGGSRLVAWQMMDEQCDMGRPAALCHLDTPANVTMMATRPGGWGEVLVAFEDGTLSVYALVVRPRPQGVASGDPEIPDGNGVEPFRKWRHEGAGGHNLRFDFNNRGSLILLRGYASPEDIRVVNRTFVTVAVLDLPFEEGQLLGIEWSSTDRYLVAWGRRPGEGDMSFVVHDVPTFEVSEDLSLDFIEDLTFFVSAIEFLPGDEALAIGCQVDDDVAALMVLDLERGSVIAETTHPDLHHLLELHLDGEDLVGIDCDGRVSTFSGPDWTFELAWTPSNVVRSSCIDGDLGWLLTIGSLNFTAFTGDPRVPLIELRDLDISVYGAAWTGVEGDLVLALDRRTEGYALQLWQTRDRLGLEGVQVLSELGTGRQLVMVAADPAYRGLVAASFVDGTFALYHLNVTPYPPPPEEIGGEDVGPIDGGDGGDGDGDGDGSGAQPWGSAASDLFLVVLVASSVLLLALYAWLRRGRR